MEQAQLHVTAFRYHHHVTKEFKDTGALLKDKFTPVTRSLLHFLADLTVAGEVTATANWLEKEKYVAGGGPYLKEGDTTKFRHFQLRLLLERHKKLRPWGPSWTLCWTAGA